MMNDNDTTSSSMNEMNSLFDCDQAIRPFLQTAKEFCSGSSTVDITTIRTFVFQVLTSSTIFNGFDEMKHILEPTLVSGDNNTACTNILQTLDLFSYGTYRDYTSNPSKYLNLTESCLWKLRQLTVLTLIQQACSSTSSSSGVVSYRSIAYELGLLEQQEQTVEDMESIYRQVEEVLLSCLYARVLSGQLCQKTGTFLVSSRHGPPCRSRDVPFVSGGVGGNSSIQDMLQTLTKFHQRLQQCVVEEEEKQETLYDQFHSNQQLFEKYAEKKKKAELAKKGHHGIDPSATTPMETTPSSQSAGTTGGSIASAPPRRQSKRSRAAGSGLGGQQFERY